MKLLIFPTPLNAHCELTPDPTGKVIVGQPDTHSSGRPGQSFTLPDGLPTGNGSQLSITAPGKVPLLQRGILWVGGGSVDTYFQADDFHLADEKVCPDPTPIPPTPIPPPTDKTPLGIIKSVYATGLYDLNTKEGCGKFTEACCKSLHELLDTSYGHLRKSGAQNQYNGHAVDALQRLSPQLEAGIFDIIISSESPQAQPAYNKAGDADPSKWYYPA